MDIIYGVRAKDLVFHKSADISLYANNHATSKRWLWRKVSPFDCPFSSGMLRKVTLELTVLDYDRIGGSDPIGKVRLGYSRKKLEKKHWAEMVENPRRPVIHWHVLQVRKISFMTCNLRLGEIVGGLIDYF